MGALAGKVAVITGASRGLGLAMAQALAAEGAAVVVCARCPDTVEAAAARLRAAGHRAVGLACDVSDPDQVRSLALRAVDAFGGFHVWINNAGISAPYGPTTLVAPERFVQVVHTNVLGTYYGSMAALDHFLAHGGGKLINVLGRGDRGPAPMQNAYGASKAWARAFTLALAKEHASSNVGVFAFNPGLVDTELLRRVEVVRGHEDRLAAFPTVVRMWARPPHVPARKLVWLASPATDGRTGLHIRATGPVHLLVGLLGETWRRLGRSSGAPAPLEMVSLSPQRFLPAAPDRPGDLPPDHVHYP